MPAERLRPYSLQRAMCPFGRPTLGKVLPLLVYHLGMLAPVVGVPKGYVDADPDVLQVRSPSFRAPTYTLFRIRTSATSALLIRQGQCYRVEEGARSGLLLLMVVVAPRPSPWNAVVVAAAAAATYCTTRLRR